MVTTFLLRISLLLTVLKAETTSTQNYTKYQQLLQKENGESRHLQTLQNHSRHGLLKEIRLGVIVEKASQNDFDVAVAIFRKSMRQNFQIIPKILNRTISNTPYGTLRTICNSFEGGNSIHGLVFVCEDPCAGATTYEKLGRSLGWAGIRVYRSNEEQQSPFIHTGEPITVLDLEPPEHDQNKALIQLLAKFQWKTICLIHDSSHKTLHLVHNLREIMKHRGFVISYRIVLGEVSDDKLLLGLKSVWRTARVFVMYCDYKRAISVLEHASRQRLTDKEHAWIVGEMVLQSATTNVPRAFPVGLLAIEYHRQQDSRTNDIVDAMTAMTYGIGHVIKGELSISVPQVNCGKADDESYEFAGQVYSAIKDVKFEGRTGMVSFANNGDRTGARYTFLNLRETNGQRYWEKVGYVENDHVTLQQIVWPGGVVHTPSGLPRARMRILMYEVAPLLYVRDLDPIATECAQGLQCTLVSPKDNGLQVKCCYGLCIDLIMLLSRDIGFVPEIRTIQGGRAGSYVNGKWTGLIGEVLSGNADMAISSISITAERSKFVDFSEPFLHTGSTILVAKRHGSFKGDGFLKPFKISAWLLIFAVLYLVAAIIFLFESKNPGLQRRKHRKYRGHFDIHASIWLMFSRLFSGILNSNVPRFVSSRVVLSSWSFAALMIGALYTANLAAFMVLKEQAHYIDGINDSRIQNPSASVLKFATIRDTSVEKYFRNNFPHVYKFMRNYAYNHSSEGVRAVKEGKIDAFIWESATLERYVANDSHCSLLTVGKLFDANGFAAAFLKGSPWTQNVSDLILKYQQTDVQGDLREKWQKGSCRQSGAGYLEEISMGSLNIANIAGVFYMLGAGVLLSLLVLAGESLYSYACASKARERDWVPDDEHMEHGSDAPHDFVIRREPSSGLLDQQQSKDDAIEWETNAATTECAQTLDLLENELLGILNDLHGMREKQIKWLHKSSWGVKYSPFKHNHSKQTPQMTELVTSLTLTEVRELIGSLESQQTCAVADDEAEFCLFERESIV